MLLLPLYNENNNLLSMNRNALAAIKDMKYWNRLSAKKSANFLDFVKLIANIAERLKYNNIWQLWVGCFYSPKRRVRGQRWFTSVA